MVLGERRLAHGHLNRGDAKGPDVGLRVVAGLANTGSKEFQYEETVRRDSRKTYTSGAILSMSREER